MKDEWWWGGHPRSGPPQTAAEEEEESSSRREPQQQQPPPADSGGGGHLLPGEYTNTSPSTLNVLRKNAPIPFFVGTEKVKVTKLFMLFENI